MLTETNADFFREKFTQKINPFISIPFIELNSYKVDRLLYLADKADKPDMGIVLGVRNGFLYSPFSAPFGGFHYRHESVYISEVDLFVAALKKYVTESEYNGLYITLPPEIYSTNMNAKFINSFIRNGYFLSSQEITNYILLQGVSVAYKQHSARKYYEQALRNGLSFEKTEDADKISGLYELIKENRSRMGRSIYMTVDDLRKIEPLWPVDYFIVRDLNSNIVAAAIFYRAHTSIVQGIFWGDSLEGRPLRAMDFMSLELSKYYKRIGFQIIDLGISTEAGMPNHGLLRFKETHESNSSIRFTFSYLKN